MYDSLSFNVKLNYSCV